MRHRFASPNDIDVDTRGSVIHPGLASLAAGPFAAGSAPTQRRSPLLERLHGASPARARYNGTPVDDAGGVHATRLEETSGEPPGIGACRVMDAVHARFGHDGRPGSAPVAMSTRGSVHLIGYAPGRHGIHRIAHRSRRALHDVHPPRPWD